MHNITRDSVLKAAGRISDPVKLHCVSLERMLFRVRSQSEPGVEYAIKFSVTEAGVRQGYCTCPAQVLCKHMAAALGYASGVRRMRRAR